MQWRDRVVPLASLRLESAQTLFIRSLNSLYVNLRLSSTLTIPTLFRYCQTVLKMLYGIIIVRTSVSIHKIRAATL